MIDKKQLSIIELVGGMALLLLGRKIEGIAVFGKGIYDLEKIYKSENPDLEPGFEKRWEKAINFYEETHSDKTNRVLHMLGIPLILGGALGLLASKPYKSKWLFSGGLFAFGWFLNIIGHYKYEKNKPAFFDDPLSFVAGPIWDIKQLTNKNSNKDDIVLEQHSNN
jgi:hypothetical protein